jgi:hypothetical protein
VRSSARIGLVPKYYYRLPDVEFDKSWTIGAVRFLPAAAAREVLAPALKAAPGSESIRRQQEVVDGLLAEWGNDAVVEVADTEGADAADRVAEDALAVLRFFMRSHIQANVEIHKIGLTGEVRGGIREYVSLWDDEQLIAATGWRRIGGTVPFRFTAEVLEKWEADPAIQLLGGQLGREPSDRSTAGRRSFTAITMLDMGFRSLESELRVLCGAMAVEVLFSRDGIAEAQTSAIARRIAYLTCPGGCGRSAPLCLYTAAAKGQKQLMSELLAHAQQGKSWQCSTYLDIVAPPGALHALLFPPLFEARNAIAHRGEAIDAKSLTHLVWVMNKAIAAGLAWYGRNPESDMSGLDAEIDGSAA